MLFCPKCKKEIKNLNWECNNCNYIPEQKENIYLFEPEFAFNNEYFTMSQLELYKRYEKNNFWLLQRKNMIVNLISKYITTKEQMNFFEIGCGTGYILEEIQNRFPNANIYGSDIFYETIASVSKRLKKGLFIQMNALNIPYKQEFDAIGMFDVLEHIEEDESVLQQVYQALKNNGKFFIIVPQHPFLWSNSDVYSGHKRRYTYKDLKEKLKRNGFDIEFKTSFMCFLLPLMILARILKKFNKNNADISDEIKINPIINFIFKIILSIENWFINRNTNFLFGGSLVIVATKNNY